MFFRFITDVFFSLTMNYIEVNHSLNEDIIPANEIFSRKSARLRSILSMDGGLKSQKIPPITTATSPMIIDSHEDENIMQHQYDRGMKGLGL